MENMYAVEKDEDQIILPPGFRFHPTDEELITHYLSKKVQDGQFCAIAIGEADLNKSEPWDLPWIAKIGEKEWYFFVLRDKKYPTGLRTNRATKAGYWKATGKDKEIYRGKCLVGMKKTLVFYTGRAPKGGKSNWVMHEYRLEGKFSLQNLPQSAKMEWVICRVFEKNSGGKKIHISRIMKMNADNDLSSLGLPALMDSSPCNKKQGDVTSESMYAPCFSNPINVQSNQEHLINRFNNSIFSVSSNPCDNLNASNFYYSGDQVTQNPVKNLQNTSYFMMEDQETNGSNIRRELFKTERDMASVSHETDTNKISSGFSNFGMGRRSFDYHEDPSSSFEPLDIDGFWS